MIHTLIFWEKIHTQISDKTQNGTTTAPQKPKIVVAAKPVPAPVPVITNGDNDNDLLPQDRPQFKVTGMAKQQLTNVALPDISVLQVEKKDKNSPPVTKIIIYKSKDPNKKPTAKLIIEKVWIFVWESASNIYINFFSPLFSIND